MNNTKIIRVWSALYGKPAWSIKQGHGSFLTMEFGQPELCVREPIIASPDASKKVTEALARRRVHVRGAWHFRVYRCNWTITLHGQQAAHNNSARKSITYATERLDGQKLVSVSRGESGGSWTFIFDLGGELKTSPYGDDPSYEQWLLYEPPPGKVLVVRADDRASYHDGSTSPEDTRWALIDDSNLHAT